MRRAFLAGVLCVAAQLGAAEVPEAVEGVVNYRRIQPGLAASGRVDLQAIPRLKALGFKTIVDLREPSEGTAEERALVEAEGLEYVSVPVTAASFSPADVWQVRAILEDPARGPILLHCASGNRSGAVWAAFEAERGASLDAAEAEGRRAGLSGQSMVEAFRRVAREAAGEKDAPPRAPGRP
jgi:uncharacterized protein (TIGR01244 family)